MRGSLLSSLPGLAASCRSPRAASRGGRGLRARAAQAEEVKLCAQLSERSKRAIEAAAKRRGHGLGEPLLLPGTAGPALRTGAPWGLPAPRVPDARLHQPLGSQNRRRLPGGQPHSQQVRIHQHRTGNRWLAGFSALKLRGRGNAGEAPTTSRLSPPRLSPPPLPDVFLQLLP